METTLPRDVQNPVFFLYDCNHVHSCYFHGWHKVHDLLSTFWSSIILEILLGDARMTIYIGGLCHSGTGLPSAAVKKRHDERLCGCSPCFIVRTTLLTILHRFRIDV